MYHGRVQGYLCVPEVKVDFYDLYLHHLSRVSFAQCIKICDIPLCLLFLPCRGFSCVTAERKFTFEFLN